MQMNYFNVPEGILYKPMTFGEFLCFHKSFYNKDGLRLGQRFWNLFGPDGKSNPEIFYQADANVARELIRKLLEESGYSQGLMPPTVQEIRSFNNDKTKGN